MVHIGKGEKSIEFIIQCAIDEVAENGNKATLNSICSKHNISKGRMYHFFSSKEDLYFCCCKYSLDKITEKINHFKIDEDATLEKNLHNYYLEIINHWLRHPNEIIFISTITKMSAYAFNDDNLKRLQELKSDWAKTVTDKFVEITNSKNKKMRVDAAITNQIISTLYSQLFLTFSSELISALKQQDYTKAKEIKNGLLKYYDILIRTFLYGIIDE